VKLRENLKIWKNVGDRVKSQNDLRVFFYFFKVKIMFKSHQIKSNHRVLRKNEVEIYGAPVFATDYSAIVLAAIICTNSNVHCMYTRFL
jgi:hypothetical protein